MNVVLVTNEEERRKKKQKGWVVKLDFEKAYDKVDWGFLGEVLEKKGFGCRWRKWIERCLNFINFSNMTNKRPKGNIRASKGLRQDDSFSPFLIVLCTDVFEFIAKKG